MAGVKEASKASNSHSSAYTDTVEDELCSKNFHNPSTKNQMDFCQLPLHRGASFFLNRVLTVWGFFDTLTGGMPMASRQFSSCIWTKNEVK